MIRPDAYAGIGPVLRLPLASAGGWFAAGWLYAKISLVLVLIALHGLLSAGLPRVDRSGARPPAYLPLVIMVALVAALIILVGCKPGWAGILSRGRRYLPRTRLAAGRAVAPEEQLFARSGGALSGTGGDIVAITVTFDGAQPVVMRVGVMRTGDRRDRKNQCSGG